MPSMVASTTLKLVAGCEAAGDATQIPYMADSTTTPCRRAQNPMRISMLRVNWPQQEIHTPISGVPEGTVTSVIGPPSEATADGRDGGLLGAMQRTTTCNGRPKAGRWVALRRRCPGRQVCPEQAARRTIP